MRRKHHRCSGVSITEFGPALILLFLLLPPLINLLGYAWSVGTAFLITNYCVEGASESRTYGEALTAMQNRVQQVANSGLGVFAHLSPRGGYSGCGADLYVAVTDVNAQKSVTYGPDTAPPPPIDPVKNVYEYKVQTSFSVRPFLNLAALPFIGNVPMIGRSTELVNDAFRAVEQPKGLDSTVATGAPLAPSPLPIAGSPAAAALTAGPPPIGAVAGIAPTVPLAGGSTGLPAWRDPALYSQITGTIVAQDVFTVNATDKWVNSGITVSPGETIWIDSRSDGWWWWNAAHTSAHICDANGINTSPHALYFGANAGALIGCQGATPPITPGSNSPNLFVVGDTMLNHPVSTPGPISVMINDTILYDNAGTQIVRIVVTR